MNPLIDFANPVKTQRIVNRKPRTDTCYWVSCPQCGERRLLRSADAKKAAKEHRLCRGCHTSTAGKKGYAATVAKYGEKFSVDFVRKYRLENPSPLEWQVMQQLLQADVPHEREVLVEYGKHAYLVDFIIGNLAIEVNGGVHIFHQERDARKVRDLRSAGYIPITIPENKVPDALDIIMQHMKPEGELSYA